MTVRKSLVLAASSALSLVFVGNAHGGVAYKYTVDASQMSYNVAAGTSITLNIYLNEAVTGAGNTSILAPNLENGLSGAGFALSALPNGLTLPSTITSAAFNNDAASNQFNGGTFNVKAVTAVLAQVSESNFSSASGTGVELGNNPPLATATGISTPSNDVFLGTVTLTAGTTPGTTIFDLGAGTGAFAGNTVTTENTFDLDQSGVANGTGADGTTQENQAYTGVGSAVTAISVTVLGTPEPASIGLVGLVSTLGLLSRRRKA